MGQEYMMRQVSGINPFKNLRSIIDIGMRDIETVNTYHHWHRLDATPKMVAKYNEVQNSLTTCTV